MFKNLKEKLFKSKKLKEEIRVLKEKNSNLRFEIDMMKLLKEQRDLKWAAFEALIGKVERSKIDDLSEDEQQSYFIGCHELLENPHFNRLIDDFLHEQEQHILKNVEDENILKNVRSTTIALDQVKVRAKQYADKLKKESVEFDKHAIISD